MHCFRPGYDDDQLGKLVQSRAGNWLFDYRPGEEDDEKGFRFGEERFVVGEHFSILRMMEECKRSASRLSTEFRFERR